MPHLDSHQSEAQFRSLFEKLMLMEAKLDELLCLQRQEQELRVHPPLRAEYLDIIDMSKLLKANGRLLFLRAEVDEMLRRREEWWR